MNRARTVKTLNPFWEAKVCTLSAQTRLHFGWLPRHASGHLSVAADASFHFFQDWFWFVLVCTGTGTGQGVLARSYSREGLEQLPKDFGS